MRIALVLLFTITALTASAQAQVPAGGFQSETDLSELIGLRGEIKTAITLPVTVNGVINSYTLRRYYLKGAALPGEIGYWDSLHTYCWIEGSDTIEPTTFVVKDVTRANGWWARKHDSRIMLETDAGFNIVCSRGANTWRNPSQYFDWKSNGLELRNLKHAFGSAIQFEN